MYTSTGFSSSFFCSNRFGTIAPLQGSIWGLIGTVLLALLVGLTETAQAQEPTDRLMAEEANLFTRAAAGMETTGIAEVADMNEDDRLDVVVASSGSVVLYLQNDDGTFDKEETELPGIGGVFQGNLSVADVDGNQRPDLLLTGRAGSPFTRMYLQNENGTFSEAGADLPGVRESATSIADVNDDGTPDALVTGQDENGTFTATLYYGNGDGTFSAKEAGLTGVTNGGTAIADFNDDGLSDLLITGFDDNFENSARIYLQQDDGSFSAAGAGLTGTSNGSPSVADVNDDGNLDLLLVGWDGDAPSVSLYYGNGDGTFDVARTDLAGVTDQGSSAIADVDEDGNQDLLITGNGGSNLSAILYLGTGDGSFQAANAGLTGVNDGSASIADMDGDGDRDLVISGSDTLSGPSPTRLYVNRTVQTGPNRPPQFSTVFEDESVAAGLTRRWVVEAGDLDGDPLSIEAQGTNVSVKDAGTGVAEVLFASERSLIGQTVNLTVEATDSEGSIDSFSRSLEVPGRFAALDAGLTEVGESSASVADVDGDGNTDVLITETNLNGDPTTTLYLGNGDGTFAKAGANLAGVSFGSTSFGEVNGDGHLDLLITGRDANDDLTTTLYLGNGDGTFQEANAELTGVVNGATSIADVSGDGNQDLLVTGRDGNVDPTATLYLGAGDGTFTAANADLTGVQASSTSIADVNGDGNPDLLVTGQDGDSDPSATLYLGAGDGTFTAANANLIGAASGAISIADVNGNGDKDLLITGTGDGNSDGATEPTAILYLGEGNASFSRAQAGLTGVSQSGASIADMNGDGTQDLVVTGEDAGGAPNTALYLGNGDGTFQEANAGLTGVANGATSIVDVNGDANEDLLITGTNMNGAPTATLYENLTGSTLLASATETVSTDGSRVFDETGTEINFSGTTGSGPVTVEKHGNGPSNPSGIEDANISSYRFEIESGGDLSFTDNTEVRLEVGTLAGVDDPTNVTVYQRPSVGSGTFSELSTTYNSDTDQLVATTGSFSEFVLASDSEPLPVELARFEGTSTEDGVRLTWRTVSEEENAGFAIQRRATDESSDSWSQVGFIESKATGGTTDEPKSYRFTDAGLPYEADRLTYRLRQVDLDGSATYSREISIRHRTQKLELKAPAPHPARNQATVRFAVPGQKNARMVLHDVLGRTVRTVLNEEIGGRQKRQLDLSGLPSGTYFLRLQAGDEARTRRLTIVR